MGGHGLDILMEVTILNTRLCNETMQSLVVEKM